jgi:hypothetical protein
MLQTSDRGYRHDTVIATCPHPHRQSPEDWHPYCNSVFPTFGLFSPKYVVAPSALARKWTMKKFSTRQNFADRRTTRGSGPRVPGASSGRIRRKSPARGPSVPPCRASGSGPLRHHQRRIRCRKTDRLSRAMAALRHSRQAGAFRKMHSRPLCLFS